MDVEEQALEIRVDLPKRADALRAAINFSVTAGQRVYFATLEQGRSLSGRLRQVVKDLTLPTLFVLQLLHVAQRRHAWAVAVDVLTRHRPAGSHDREPAEAGFTQDGLRLAATSPLLPVDGAEWHVSITLAVQVAVGARLDGVADRPPVFEVAVSILVLDADGQVVVTELLDHLPDRHVELAVEAVHPVVVVRANGVLACRQNVVVDDFLEVERDDGRRRAVEGALAVDARKGSVSVTASEDPQHPVRYIVQPLLDRRELVEIRVWSSQPHPRTGRAGSPGHQACFEDLQGTGRRAVDDVVVSALPSVPVRRQEATSSRKVELAQLLPVRLPRRQFGPESLLASAEVLDQRPVLTVTDRNKGAWIHGLAQVAGAAQHPGSRRARKEGFAASLR